MLRIVYTSTEIMAVIGHDPTMGTTYTPYNVIVCTPEEAYAFFANYPQEEIDKITEYINNPTSGSTVENVEL